MMRPCAKKAGMRMKIVKKSGLPFLLSKNRVHAGLAVGAVCFILITAALSGRIWTVNVTGCETVPEEDIRETVERFGVYPGMRKNSSTRTRSPRRRCPLCRMFRGCLLI